MGTVESFKAGGLSLPCKTDPTHESGRTPVMLCPKCYAPKCQSRHPDLTPRVFYPFALTLIAVVSQSCPVLLAPGCKGKNAIGGQHFRASTGGSSKTYPSATRHNISIPT
eukprot:scaffold3374_cov115-Skeletonema_dohrnii-CCMP3373.AAC.5